MPSRSRTRSSWARRRSAKFVDATSDGDELLDVATRDRPYPAWLVGGQVARLRWDDPDVTRFLRTGTPVVLTGGCPLTAKLIGKWTFDHLAERMPSSNEQLTAHFAPRHVTRFNRFYGQGLGKGGVTSMSFRTFAETSAANEKLASPPWRYYMQAPMVWAEGRGKGAVAGGQLSTATFGRLNLASIGPGLTSDLRDAIGWDWLGNVCETAETLGFHSCTMWAGCGGGCTPLHWDAMSNFFAQIVGRKRVLIFPPDQSGNVYPHVQAHPMDSYAEVDVERPDLATYPALARARALEVIMHPGEVLWLPSFCWHYVRQLDAGSENMSLNFWVRGRGVAQGTRGGGACARQRTCTRVSSCARARSRTAPLPPAPYPAPPRTCGMCFSAHNSRLLWQPDWCTGGWQPATGRSRKGLGLQPRSERGGADGVLASGRRRCGCGFSIRGGGGGVGGGGRRPLCLGRQPRIAQPRRVPMA